MDPWHVNISACVAARIKATQYFNVTVFLCYFIVQHALSLLSSLYLLEICNLGLKVFITSTKSGAVQTVSLPPHSINKRSRTSLLSRDCTCKVSEGA